MNKIYITYFEDKKKQKQDSYVEDPLEFLTSRGRYGAKDMSLYNKRQKATRVEETNFDIPEYHKKILINELETIKNMNKHIESFLESHNPDTEYITFKIPKRSGGQRTIDAPAEDLKRLQQHVATVLKRDLGFLEHEIAHGYVPDRSIVTNAQTHKNSNHFAKVDFKDFFPTFDSETIREQLKKISLFAYTEAPQEYLDKYRDNPISTPTVVNYSGRPVIRNYSDIIHELKRLLENIISIATKNDVLPQGSPLSPLLTNLLMIPFDHAIIEEFTKHEKAMIVTRYVDDLEFSSYYPFSEPKSSKFEAKEKLHDAINEVSEKHYDGKLRIKEKKTRVTTKEGKNRITGLKVNKDNNVTIGYKEKRWLKHELAKAIINKKNGTETPYLDEIIGYLSFLNGVEPDYARHVEETIKRKFDIPRNAPLRRWLTR